MIVHSEVHNIQNHSTLVFRCNFCLLFLGLQQYRWFVTVAVTRKCKPRLNPNWEIHVGVNKRHPKDLQNCSSKSLGISDQSRIVSLSFIPSILTSPIYLSFHEFNMKSKLLLFSVQSFVINICDGILWIWWSVLY